MKMSEDTQQAAYRCAKAQMTRAARLLERAKDEPQHYEQLYAAACRSEELARMWEAEAERAKQHKTAP
jgi:hypothetical protein